ncbi:hypothetical protein FQZ97_1279410 [compost metagenome]
MGRLGVAVDVIDAVAAELVVAADIDGVFPFTEEVSIYQPESPCRGTQHALRVATA